MQRPEANEYNPNYQKYFDLVPAGEYLELLRRNEQHTSEFLENIPAPKHSYRYAEGKWTIKEIVMHIIDTERVFACRALAAARGESETPFYRMDEELYARNVDVSDRTMLDLVSEFRAVRNSSEYLFQHMNDESSRRWCNVVTHPMTARAIGYFLIGHAEHHVGVVKDRYLLRLDVESF
jgi:uncharacterized damage-inducible protein DinB